MYEINEAVVIAAPLGAVHLVVTTKRGIQAWWVEDVLMTDSSVTVTFENEEAGMQATFAIDRIDEHGIAMTCVRESANPDWLGTTLELKVTAAPGGTRVELRHAGYPAKNETFENCMAGWAHYMVSLSSYMTTGRGDPWVAKKRRW